MPWEIVADFAGAGLGTSEEDQRWAKIAIAVVHKMLMLEPRLRVVLRGLPPPKGNRSQLVRLKREHVHPLFQDRLEPPEGRSYLVRQYFCKTCGVDKPQWFPQAYLPLHKGHDIKRTAPTGRAQKASWVSNFRLYIGSGDRLVGTSPGLPAACVTSIPTDPKGLANFDWIFLAPAMPEALDRLLAATSAELVRFLPTASVDTPQFLISNMSMLDDKLLEGPPISQESEDDPDALEVLRKRITIAQNALTQASLQKSSSR